ncbi:MAG: 2-oxo-tetronate isomerase [Candidatus Methylomirabilia bacterium]
MPKFAANLSMMFQEVGFLDRFDAAAGVGFRAVEYLFPYDFPPQALAERLKASGLEQVLFNLPPGDWAAGERGLAALPGREVAFREGVQQALEYARTLECRQVHAMAGIPPTGVPRETCEAVYVQNLRFAAEELKASGIRILMEPINTRDMPGYFLNTVAQARQIREAVGSDNLFLQLDFYHCQVMEGDLAERFKANLGWTKHVQIAGTPGRHEPDVGEIHYPYLFGLMDELGYAGWIGCEYRPRGGTVVGLGWARRYGIGQPAQPEVGGQL